VESGDKAGIQFLTSYFEREASVASQIDLRQVVNLIGELHVVAKGNGRVYIAGNGGSAATADHFAVDLGVGAHIRKKARVINAMSLSSNNDILTALGNDVSFDNIF
jgi:D-sedoheptulose 7-phosphate isomerase